MKHHQPLSAHSDLVAGGTQQSGDDGKEILEHALASFQSTLYDEERGVEQFYQIADTYVSSHPEIAALVWGSVKLAFMILSNFTSYFQRFSELLRGFDQLIPRFSEYRRLFPNSNRLRLATYGFQTAIIRCCSQIVLATRRPWKQQLLAALSQSFQTEMRPLVDDIRASAKRVMEEVELAQAQATHQEQVLQSQERQMAGKSRREVSRWFAKSDKDIQKLRQKELARAKEYKWDALLEKLSRYDHAAAFKSARAKRHNGTAEWVLHTLEFETWYHNNSSVILHLVGKIGAGKTILTANVVDHLILSRTHDQAIAFLFILIGSNSPISLTLTEADIHANILDIISQYIAVGGRLEVSDLTDHEKCNLKSIEEHRSGISHDVCFMLCTGRSISVNRKWMQLSAQVSVSDLNDDLFQRITDTLMNSHILFESRTIKGKTILNLIIERDVNWWLALSDWMSNNLRTWLTVNTLMKDSLRFSLKSQDETSWTMILFAVLQHGRL
ncbi:hypothetical protein CcaCcLH18_02321 [Colletotrichum camelliae]|nr:hypothetical protein CcaCcLH18_02321 [Colletotrichum camelliae]